MMKVEELTEAQVKLLSSFFMEFDSVRGYDPNTPIGEVAAHAYRHWKNVERIKDENINLEKENKSLANKVNYEKSQVEFYKHNYEVCRKIIDSLQRKRRMFDLLAKMLNSPDYVQDNLMCYFYHNTTACQECPKRNECEKVEPQPMPPDWTKLEEPTPNAKAIYTVRVGEQETIAIPNPEKNYTEFCYTIRDLFLGLFKKR